MQRFHRQPCFSLTKPKEGVEMEVCGTYVPPHFQTKLLGQAQSHEQKQITLNKIATSCLVIIWNLETKGFLTSV